MATSVRVAGTSLLPIVGYSGLLSLAVVELAILAEYAGHQRFTFPVVNGERRSGSSRRRLAAFHLVAANSLLAQAGLGSVVTSMLARPTTGVRLVPVLGLVTAGVMVTIVAAYHLNRVVTWPAQTEAGGGATELPSPNSSRRTVDQQSRPMTPSTSEAISSTARR
jgi:putative flippase GtrA